MPISTIANASFFHRLTAKDLTYRWFQLTLIACSFAPTLVAAQTENISDDVDHILARTKICSSSISLRSAALSKAQENATCTRLSAIEKQFHQLFAQNGHQVAPVKQDNNSSLRANIYRSQTEFTQYAGAHFNMPTDNGGMYLEGSPEQIENHAEFVAYQREHGEIHNLEHEYVHYLDGRFNLYGDFCANLHDSHAAPENCARPSPLMPYLVWWTEGLAEYIAHGSNHSSAVKTGATHAFALSELFNTGYDSNNGGERIYTWGYLATRFMIERQRDKVEQLLHFTRLGDYPRYQALVKSWGSTMDAEFSHWLNQLSTIPK